MEHKCKSNIRIQDDGRIAFMVTGVAKSLFIATIPPLGHSATYDFHLAHAWLEVRHELDEYHREYVECVSMVDGIRDHAFRQYIHVDGAAYPSIDSYDAWLKNLEELIARAKHYEQSKPN